MEINLNETYNTVRKYALVESIGTGFKDIWDASVLQGLMQYIPYAAGGQPQGETIYISSDNNSDTYDLKVIGIGANGKWLETVKALAGFTKTALNDQFFRVFDAFNASDTPSFGNIYIYRNSSATLGIPDDLTKLQAHIINGAIKNEETQMSHFTIPFDMRGWIKSYSLSVSEVVVAKSTLFKPFIRSPGSVFKLQDTKSINTSGTGSFERNFDLSQPDINHDFPLEPGMDIVWRSVSTEAGNGVSCEYIIKLARLQ